jgi:hypothetical protein
MPLQAIAYSPWWIVVCGCALLAIYWDWDSRTKRQLVVALLIAIVAGSVLYAAEVPNPDYCAQLRDVYFWSWWQLYLIGCW